MGDQHREASRGNILVVDDKPANLRLLTNLLTEEGFLVRPLTDGESAISAVELEPPDLILLDIRMPKMSGYEVCERLKKLENARDIPVLFISALDATEDKVTAFKAGGVDYITKPFQVEEVLARVETHLSLRNLQMRLSEANEKMTRELTIAGEVQNSFLPREHPQLKGWQIAARLKPARETSGDYYDIWQLPDGNLAVLIADVVDKGVGAALFMALTRTLFRTYSIEHPTDPELMFLNVNQRILEDTKANQFVTVFYGAINPQTGAFIYGNAGHVPPIIFGDKGMDIPEVLMRTGMPLGISTDEQWGQSSMMIDEKDVLVFYTDGITEAKNGLDELFGEERLHQVLIQNHKNTVDKIQNEILLEVEKFMGEQTQADDIALVVIKRE